MKQESRIVKDQMGMEVELSFPPFRIVSLVPSQTELLHDLGLENEVIGITKFCVHPESWFRSKTRVGGTKKLDLEKIAALNPDLIIANKEENTQSEIDWLAQRFPVWISNIITLEDALQMIVSVGEITNRAPQANFIADKIRSSFSALSISKRRTALYLIWKDPIMAAGRNTFIHQMLEKAGFENAITDPESRYPELSDEEITKLNPDIVLLSSEPFPFKGKHTEALKQRFPSLTFKEVDGELFSWYGSRLLKSAEYFGGL